MPTNVTIELSIGIPSAVVLYSLLGYGGAFNGGTKCNPKPTVDLDKAGSVSMTVPALTWSTTKRYDEADAIVVAGKPDWYRSLRSGAPERESQQLVRAPENLDVQFSQIADATHAVKFVVNGPNPLLSLAPGINAEIVVGLRKTATAIEYIVKGDHDGFPNYTLLLNGKTVYAWNCVDNGETPLALRPPMDQSVDTGWKQL
ncbi:hypothetical protein [Variovorax ginsengisoli]|uniref:Inclusion body protein n=1 Tax=Variovorax ginsengisoli TaxID=363844 RepID=A0ABT8SDE6_9BURK|nr:hypothetical protein [Variovorax ginsengisoli]MDN8616291.1 hypothetical protein [Variovorax ginsengisoli]MDO1535461.1 hypothetical protein [Variovorax ginsengisoli]